MKDLQNAAKIGFASEFSFYLKAHNFHWNVTGSDFLEYHDLFGKIYEEVYGSIDDYAEKINDETDILTKDQMVAELLQDNEKMINILKLVYDVAEQNREHGFSNFLAERMDAHRKHGWMLRSSIEGIQNAS